MAFPSSRIMNIAIPRNNEAAPPREDNNEFVNPSSKPVTLNYKGESVDKFISKSDKSYLSNWKVSC